MQAHQTRMQGRMSLKLILVIVAIGTILSGFGARWFANSMDWNGQASYYKVNHQVDLPDQANTVRK